MNNKTTTVKKEDSEILKQEEFEYKGTVFKATVHSLERVKERFLKEKKIIDFIKTTIKGGFYHYSSSRRSYCVANVHTDCALIITTEFVIVTAIRISSPDEGCSKNKFIKTALDKKKKFKEYLI